MAIYFLSDLHLPAGIAPATIRLQRFLQERLSVGDTLILGGDIFDLFVGNKSIFKREYAELLEQIRGVARAGIVVHYLEGNHDFHIAAVFAGQENIHVHERGFSLQAVGKKIWVAHGDEIDREDYGYRFLRFITRTSLFQVFLAALPEAILARIGEWSSKQSRKYNRVKPDTLWQERTRRLFREYALQQASLGYELILLGHSHLADHFRMGETAEYCNLGYSSEVLLYACLGSPTQGLEIAQYS